MGSMGMKDEDMNGVGQESGELIQDKLSMMSMKNEKKRGYGDEFSRYEGQRDEGWSIRMETHAHGKRKEKGLKVGQV